MDHSRLDSKSAQWSCLITRLGLVLFAGALLLRYFSCISFYTQLNLFIAAVFFSLLGLGAALLGFKALWCEGKRAGYRCLRATFYAAMVLVPLFWLALCSWRGGSSYDISTDETNPPQFFASMRPKDSLPLQDRPSLSFNLEKTTAALSGRRYRGGPRVILPSIVQTFSQLGWKEVAQWRPQSKKTDILLQTVAKTFPFGFVSDIIIRLADEGDTSFVDIRAVSRHLKKDIGVNQALIRKFFATLDQKILFAQER